jgi:anti-anti-sigma factor
MKAVQHDNASEAAMEDIEIAVDSGGAGGEITIIRVQGFIDSNTSRHLAKVLSDKIAENCFKLVIDLAKVNYISSAGWGIFIGDIRTIQTHGGDLKLAALAPEVEEVYQLMEFFNILKSYDTLDAAIRDF